MSNRPRSPPAPDKQPPTLTLYGSAGSGHFMQTGPYSVWSFVTWHLPPSLTLARPARVVGCAVLWPFGVMDNIPLSGPVTFCFFIR